MGLSLTISPQTICSGTGQKADRLYQFSKLLNINMFAVRCIPSPALLPESFKIGGKLEIRKRPRDQKSMVNVLGQALKFIKSN